MGTKAQNLPVTRALGAVPRARRFAVAAGLLAVAVCSCTAFADTFAGRKQPIKTPVRPASTGSANTAQSGSALSAAAVPGCPVAQKHGDVTFDGRIDLTDVLCVLDGFAGFFGSCAFEFVDLYPCDGGDGNINIDDVSAVLAGYAGEPLCPDSCPPCATNSAPLALGGPDMSGTTAESFQFDARLSSDADGHIVSYEWDFGDGTRSSLPATSKVYANPGTFNVTLAVLDSCGRSTTDAVRVTVAAATCVATNQIPIARAGNDRAAAVGASLTFNGSASSDPDGTIAQYWWSFGDGYSTGWQLPATSQHGYSQGGSYIATLWVKDNCGAVSLADTATVVVGSNPCANNQSPIATLIGPPAGLTGVPVALSAVGSADLDGTIQSYSWTFGDGQSASGQTVSHPYSAGGTYTVSLTVTDNCGAIDTEQLTISISSQTCGLNNLPPVALGGIDRTAAVNVSIAFNGAASSDPDGSVTEYWWNFGDGYSTNWQSSPVVQHAYAAPAVYTAKLWVRDNCGVSSAPDNVIVTVTGGSCGSNVPPVANAGPNQEVEADQPISFSAESSSDADGWIQTYAWTFGDGTNGSGLNVVHTYNQAGTYSATLTVTDNCGTTRTDLAIVTVLPSSFVPIDPEFVGWVEGSIGTVQDVAVSPNGQRAYLASRDLGVVEFDITAPNAPRFTRTARVFQNAQGVVVNETYIMIGGSSTAASFCPLSTFATANETWTSLGVAAQGMALRGNFAALASGSAGFYLFNLAGSSGPALIGTVPMFARGVVISPNGQYAYVAAGNNGFRVVDIRATPVLRGSLPSAGGANWTDIVLDATGNYAFVSDSVSGMRVIDVRNPDQPRQVTTVAVNGLADRIARAGNLIAVSSAVGVQNLQLFDATNPESPQRRGEVIGYYIGTDGRNTHLYGASQGAGWSVISVANATSPQVVFHQAPLLGSRNACAVGQVGSKKLAVVGGSQTTGTVVDITVPTAPRLLATLPTLVSDVVIRGNLAYVASGFGGLRVVDLTNATTPSIVNTVTTTSLGVALVPNRPWMFVAGSSDGLKALDLTVPSLPVVRTTLPMQANGTAMDVAVNPAGNRAYVADLTAGLVVVDISTPSAPAIRSSLKFPEGPPNNVIAYGNDIVVVVNTGAAPGVSIVDVSDVLHPVRLSWIGGLSGSVDMFAHYLLMPGGTTGLSIFDLYDLTDPTIAFTADSPGSVLSVAVFGDYAYLGDDATTLDAVKLR